MTEKVERANNVSQRASFFKQEHTKAANRYANPSDYNDVSSENLINRSQTNLSNYRKTPPNETFTYSSGYSNPFIKSQTPQARQSIMKSSVAASHANLHRPLMDASHDSSNFSVNRLETSKSVFNLKASLQKENIAEKNKQLVENILQKVLGNSGISSSANTNNTTNISLSRVSSCRPGEFTAPLRPSTTINIDLRGSYQGYQQKELAHSRTSVNLGNGKGGLREESPLNRNSFVFSRSFSRKFPEKELSRSSFAEESCKENMLAKSGLYQGERLFHLENKKDYVRDIA